MRHASAKMLLLFCALAATGCSERAIFDSSTFTEAKITEPTRATNLLRALPAPSIQATVAVYSFDDQTGQFKANDKLTEYSSAVTKGGLAILNNALVDAGNKKWFKVVERGGLKNVLQERQIIRAMREQYRMPDGGKLPDIAPLTYAGMLIEGGIIGYDTNTVTGGAAANYFGIGGNTEYRSNTVTVYLRAIKIETGEVLISTTSTKTIYSMRLQGNIFKYITPDRILQAETGFTLNEPVELAVRQAIETSVYSMIMEGALNNIWSFADAGAGQQAVREYLERKGVDVSEAPPAPRSQVSRPLPQAEPAPVMAAPVAPIVTTPAPAPVATLPPPPPPAPEPAPVMAAPARAPVMQQPVVAAPEYRAQQPAPIQPPEQARESQLRPLPAEPMPAPETKVSEPQPQPQSLPNVIRTPEPNALVKYLNDSRYAKRRNTPAANCELDPAQPGC